MALAIAIEGCSCDCGCGCAVIVTASVAAGHAESDRERERECGSRGACVCGRRAGWGWDGIEDAEGRNERAESARLERSRCGESDPYAMCNGCREGATHAGLALLSPRLPLSSSFLLSHFSPFQLLQLRDPVAPSPGRQASQEGLDPFLASLSRLLHIPDSPLCACPEGLITIPELFLGWLLLTQQASLAQSHVRSPRPHLTGIQLMLRTI